jgi:hypothetical protein
MLNMRKSHTQSYGSLLKADCIPSTLGLVRRKYYVGAGLISDKKLRRVQTVQSCSLLTTQESCLSERILLL